RKKSGNSREAFNVPPGAVLAAHELIGGAFIEAEPGAVPFESGFWKARGHTAEQDGFGQWSGVVEAGRGPALASASLDEFSPMIAGWNFGILEIFELLVGIKQRAADMRQHERSLGADKNGTSVRQLVPFE